MKAVRKAYTQPLDILHESALTRHITERRLVVGYKTCRICRGCARRPRLCVFTCAAGDAKAELADTAYSNPLHTLILLAAFLMLAGVAPAASASLFRSPSFLNDVSHNAVAFRCKKIKGRKKRLE